MDDNVSNKEEIYEKIYKVNSGDMEDNVKDYLDILSNNTLIRYKNIIPESQFKEVYLPMLYKLFTAKTPKEKLEAIRNEEYISWIELSRNFGEVDVVEDGYDDKNVKILFTVPSIYGYSEINEDEVNSYMDKDLEDSAFGSFSFGKLASNFLTRADGNRFIAHKFLEKHLKNISKRNIVVNNRQKIYEKWQELFNRYSKELGIEKKEIKKETNNKEPAKEENKGMDLDELGW